MRSILPLFFLFVIAIGCGGTFNRPGQEKGIKEHWPGNSYPMDLPQDLAVVPDQFPVNKAIDTSKNLQSFKAHQQISRDTAMGPNEVYRIQIYNSNTYGPALKEFNVANEVFDGNVWLDYEVPYYKIRVGNFQTREEAEQYLQTAKDAGYPEAWVVRVKLNIKTIDEPYFRTSPMDTSSATEKLIE